MSLGLIEMYNRTNKGPTKESQIKKLEGIDFKILNSAWRKKEGWKVHRLIEKQYKWPKIGLIKVRRREYRRKENGKWRYEALLDRYEGISKKCIIHPEIKEDIRFWLREGDKHKKIKKTIERYHSVEVSKSIISFILNEKEEVKVKQRS